jgi:arginine-tRNA-protein transferase
MVEDTPIETSVAEFRLTSGRLVGACLTDRLGDGLSAVYSFFDTELTARSLGTFAIIWLVGRAVELELPNVYLGYWVEESRKMAYKAKFRPSEILRAGQWIDLQTQLATAAPALVSVSV